MSSRQEKAEAALHDQEQLLPERELLFVFGIMSLALLVGFIDQNGIGVLLPSIARDLNARSSISWAGTSALIANTVFQVLYGRLSDLFGRKNIMLSALVLLSLSDLACGLSVNATMLYIFRGLAAILLRCRSGASTKAKGILGGCIGLGNALGPLIASGFAIHATWRGLFYLLSPLIMLTVAASWIWLPTNMPKLNVRETLAKIDGLGLLFGTAAVILLLIPTSEGGHSGIEWASPQVIAMFAVGGVCLIAFLAVEWKWPELPMMPMSMFRSRSVSAMLAQSFLLGACYYAYLYFLPLYFQNVRGQSPLVAAGLQLPLVVSQSTFSTLGGLYISWTNRYAEVIWIGFGMWTLGAGLLVLAGRDTHFGLIALFLVFIGIGTGFVFQPTLVALQAHCPKSQRAVVTSVRNFLRSAGGAVGLAVSSAILANTLKVSLPARLVAVADSAFAAPDLSSFFPADKTIISAAFSDASRAVFTWCVPLPGLCFLLCALIRDEGLQRKEEREPATKRPPANDVEKRHMGDIEKANLSPRSDATSGAEMGAPATQASEHDRRQIDSV